MNFIPKQALLSLLIVISLSACAVAPGSYPAPGAPSQMQLPSAFRHFLTHAPAGTSAFLPESPWGTSVTVYAGQAYFAASGRRCRKLTIVHTAGMRRPGLVCRLPNGGWEEVRAFRGVSSTLLGPESVQINQGSGA